MKVYPVYDHVEGETMTTKKQTVLSSWSCLSITGSCLEDFDEDCDAKHSKVRTLTYSNNTCSNQLPNKCDYYSLQETIESGSIVYMETKKPVWNTEIKHWYSI